MHYLRPLVPDKYSDRYFGDGRKLRGYMSLAAGITLNNNIHDTLIRIDGTDEVAGSTLSQLRAPKYTSITEKFKDWKHLTLLVDKAIDEVKELIRTTTTYTNKKDFMSGPRSSFKIDADIAQMKRELCVINKRGELNMSLKYEGGKYTRNVKRSKTRLSKTRRSIR